MSAHPNDDFERPAGPLGTSSSGDLWTIRPTGPYLVTGADNPSQVPSEIEIQDGYAFRPDLTRLYVEMATLEFPSGDDSFEIEFDGFPVPGRALGIVFRWQDATHYWNAGIYNYVLGADVIYLERQNGPSFADRSPVWEAPIPAPITSFDNTFKVVTSGPTIEVYVNGVLGMTQTNSSFQTAIHHGIMFYGSGDAIKRFNQREVSDWSVGFVGATT